MGMEVGGGKGVQLGKLSRPAPMHDAKVSRINSAKTGNPLHEGINNSNHGLVNMHAHTRTSLLGNKNNDSCLQQQTQQTQHRHDF